MTHPPVINLVVTSLNSSCRSERSTRPWLPGVSPRPRNLAVDRLIAASILAPGMKQSSIAAKKAILGLYGSPMFGRRRLDAIKNEDVQRLKAQLKPKSPKTVNNVLNALSVLLNRAVEWEDRRLNPCHLRMLYRSLVFARVSRILRGFGDVVETAWNTNDGSVLSERIRGPAPARAAVSSSDFRPMDATLTSSQPLAPSGRTRDRKHAALRSIR